MGSTYQYLSNLSLTTKMCTIRARIARIWDAVNTDTAEKFKLHMQLLDEKEFEMLGTANKKDMARISSSVLEGQIYDITGFVVKATSPTFQAVSGTYYLEFYEGTEFSAVTQCSANIPFHRFATVGYQTIQSRLDNFETLTDVCGLLIGISEQKNTKHVKTGRPTWLKEITLLLQCGKEIVATLWREKADLINNAAMSLSKEPTTVVLTSALVKRDFTNNKNIKLSSTSATKIYFNLEVPECKQLLSGLSGIGMNTKVAQKMEFSTPSNQGIEMNIVELLNEMQSESCVGVRYIFKGEIMSVDDTFGWSYLSCKQCKGAAKKNGPTYWCPKCASNIDEPQSRFKLLLNVRDDTATIKIVAFDKEAENLLQYSVNELKQITEQEMGPTQVREIFCKLAGRIFTFNVKPTYFDYRKGGKSLAATKISTLTDSNVSNSKGKNIIPEEVPSTRHEEEVTSKTDTPPFKKKRKTKA